MRNGVFREDLYYRLNVVPIRLPPLRERLNDIPELVRHFLEQTNAEGLPEKVLTHRAIERLKHYHWPGNIRELENLIRRLTALYAEETVDEDAIERELPKATAESAITDDTDTRDGGLSDAVATHIEKYFNAHDGARPPPGLYERILHEVERPLISLTLTVTNGNQIKAASILGLNRNTLRKKIRTLGIPVIRRKLSDC